MKISHIIFDNEAHLSQKEKDIEFKNIVTNAKDIGENSLLIIPNSKKAIFDNSKVPVAVICDHNCNPPQGFTTIRVNNPRLIMAFAYFRFYNINTQKFKLIGITGTNGKSSTAMLIRNILSGCGQKVGFIGTGRIEIDGKVISDPYYSMTTPDPELLYKSIKEMEDTGCNTIVMEVSSHALSLDKVTPLHFDYGVFTNFESDHLDFHQNIDNYFTAKAKLFAISKCGVFNIDDNNVKTAYDMCNTRKISVSTMSSANARAFNVINRGLSGIEYIYRSGAYKLLISLSLAGYNNVYNSLLAISVCIDIKCNPYDVQRILSDTKALVGRYEIIKDKISVIIDYAHTASAFEALLKELYFNKENKKLTVVFGCGGNRDRTKRPIMAALAERYADKIIITSDNSRNENPQEIIMDIVKGLKENKHRIIENRAEAIRAAILFSNDDDIVAIIGKGPERYNIDVNGYSIFNENEIVSNALQERRSILQ